MSSRGRVFFLCPSFLFTVTDGVLTDCVTSGGSLYDKQLVDGLSQNGWDVVSVSLSGDAWPLAISSASEEEKAARQQELTTAVGEVGESDIVLIDGLLANDLGPALAAHPRTRVVAILHHPVSEEEGYTDEQRATMRADEKAVFPQLTRVVCTSPSTSAVAVTELGVSVDRVTVVIPGVAPFEGPPPTPATKDAEGKVHFVFCTVANVIPRKAYGDLINALAKVNTTVHTWELKAAGSLEMDPDETKKVQDLATELGVSDKIEWLGSVSPDAVNDVYASSHAFLFSSHYEGYGMVVAEAASAGLPIISTTGGALAVTVPYESSFRVPPNSVEDLAHAIELFMYSEVDRNRLVAAAEKGRNAHTWAQVVGEYEEIFDSVALEEASPEERLRLEAAEVFGGLNFAIQQWFNGTVEKSQTAFAPISVHLGANMTYVFPSGSSESGSSVADSIYAGHGTNPNLRIATPVECVSVCAASGSVAVVEVIELQTGAKAVAAAKHARRSTIVFERGEGGGLVLVRLHESLVPEGELDALPWHYME